MSSWAPQPGPQLDAICADWCPELLYGGAAGGGKSDFLLGDFLQDVRTYGSAWRGVLFRRTYPELEELIARSLEMYPRTGAVWSDSKKLWTWPNGAVLRMRYLERDLDALRYQGHQYCVAVETPILMADGTSKPMGCIEIGDMVATLEGPRRVTAKVRPYYAPCVKAVVSGGGNQTHPIWHPILTDSGWRSFASVRGIDATRFAAECQEPAQLGPVRVTAKLAARIPAEGVRGRAAKLAASAGTQYELSGESNLGPQRPFSVSSPDQPQGLSTSLQAEGMSPGGALGALEASVGCETPEGSDSQAGCHGGCRSYGEQPHHQKESAPRGPHKLGDVAERSREHFLMDVPGNIPSDNRQTEHDYLHPYDGQEYQTEWESSLAALYMTYVGQRLVADITVDGANHYICSNTALVNKNTWIGWDELTQWTSLYAYRYLKSRLRSAEHVPTKRIRAACNPGGPGHAEVKAYYVDPAPGGYEPIADPETGLERMFIPAKLRDNAILMKSDPDYASRLKGLGSAELVRCLLEGDWSVVEGAFFDGWSTERHVIKPFKIPAHWMRFRSMDWGYAKPSSIGWWAVVSDDYQVRPGLWLPRGALVRYKELYTASAPNVGRRLTAEALAAEIKAMTLPDEVIAYTAADPAIFAEDGGPAISERLALAGVHCVRADNSRVGKSGALGGWDQMRSRLKGEGDDRPMLAVFSTCKDFIRTVPILQHDRTRPEDLDTSAEDHAADEARYACMSRPYVVGTAPPAKKRDPYADTGKSRSAWTA